MLLQTFEKNAQGLASDSLAAYSRSLAMVADPQA